MLVCFGIQRKESYNISAMKIRWFPQQPWRYLAATGCHSENLVHENVSQSYRLVCNFFKSFCPFNFCRQFFNILVLKCFSLKQQGELPGLTEVAVQKKVMVRMNFFHIKLRSKPLTTPCASKIDFGLPVSRCKCLRNDLLKFHLKGHPLPPSSQQCGSENRGKRIRNNEDN